MQISVHGHIIFILFVIYQMKELEDEFSKLPPTPPAPTRLLRSHQAIAQATPTGGETVGGGGLEGNELIIAFYVVWDNYLQCTCTCTCKLVVSVLPIFCSVLLKNIFY